MVPHRLDADTVKRVRACTSDACHQGRRSCPTPAACELPEPDPELRARFWWTYLTLLAALVGAVFHFWPQIVAAFKEFAS